MSHLLPKYKVVAPNRLGLYCVFDVGQSRLWRNGHDKWSWSAYLLIANTRPFPCFVNKTRGLSDWTINFAFPLVRILWQKLLLLCSLNILKVFVYFLCFYARFQQMTLQPIKIVLFCLNTLIIGLDLFYALCCNWVLPVPKHWFF